MLRKLFVGVALSTTLLAADARAEARWSGVSASYYGETLLHPGARLASEWTLVGGGGHALWAAAALGGYYHRGFAGALFSSTEAGYRYAFDSGVELTSALGIGYLHTFLDGETYVADAGGRFERVSAAGRPGFMASAALGIGYQLAERRLAPFFRIAVFTQMPFNGRALLHPVAELGVAWRFDP